MRFDIRAEVSNDDNAEGIFQKILASRGITTEKKRQAFLSPSVPSVSELQKSLEIKKPDLQKAKDIILLAIKNKTPICIYGDYDADGVTSTAVLWETLHHMGARALPFIPHRTRHGYGLSFKGIDEILSGEAFANSPLHPFKPELVITVDNGIVASEQIEYLKSKGCSVIVTDHHQKDSSELPADVIIHSTVTSGAGVAWLLSLFLSDEAKYVKDMIDIATIGIVADLVPLTGINRSIVYHGLKLLPRTRRPGLQELYRLSGIAGKSLNAYDINFVIAPRLNAMGRMKHALDALRLICSTDRNSCRTLAATVEEENKTRQDETFRSIADAKNLVTKEKIIVVSSDAYHEGVIGLVAGKLVEQYYRPAIVISIGADSAKGSARSISGFDITAALRKAKDLLDSVGGHSMAAGFSVKPENLPALIERLQEIATDSLTDAMLTKSYSVDARLKLSQNTRELYDYLSHMEPFGMGNPRPVFLTEDFSVIEERQMGTMNQHKKIVLESKGITKEAVWFNAPLPDEELSLASLIYYLDLNTWNGHSKIQLVVKEGEYR